jgi:hypothetical protein
MQLMIFLKSLQPTRTLWKRCNAGRRRLSILSAAVFLMEKLPYFFQESDVKTVQDIKNRYTDDKWVDSLENSGAKETALFWKLRRVLYANTDSRIASADYEIASSDLSHTADLDALHQRVEDTFTWYSDWQYPKKVRGAIFSNDTVQWHGEDEASV